MSNEQKAKNELGTIEKLESILKERKVHPTAESYTAKLLANQEELVKKVGEEAIEVILAALHQGQERLVSETADLIYHVLVLLVSQELSWNDIEAELNRRMH